MSSARDVYMSLLEDRFTNSDGKRSCSFISQKMYDVFVALLIDDKERLAAALEVLEERPLLKHIRHKVLYLKWFKTCVNAH